LRSDMCRRVHVRGLSYDASEADVRELFGQAGEIVKLDMPLGPQGRPKGFCFIEYDSAESASAALGMNKVEHMGRWLEVSPANATASTPADGRKSFDRAPSQKPDNCKTIFVGNLSFDIDEDTIRSTFGDCGEITNVRFATDRETGQFKGFGHVEFGDTSAVDEAMKLVGTDVMGRAIRIDYAEDRRQSSGGDGCKPCRLFSSWLQSAEVAVAAVVVEASVAAVAAASVVAVAAASVAVVAAVAVAALGVTVAAVAASVVVVVASVAAAAVAGPAPLRRGPLKRLRAKRLHLIKFSTILYLVGPVVDSVNFFEEQHVDSIGSNSLTLIDRHLFILIFIFDID
jgi:hypothetical protein